jgi:pimeloyl-ACP methyl ester carboxylesterase
MHEPLVFLHGVYFDHRLWKFQIEQTDAERTCIAIDMPLHGASTTLRKRTWDLDDCVRMVIDVLDTMQIKSAIGVGHSWGSMTLLRAAARHPQRFSALCLCNMPLEPAGLLQQVRFRAQHMALRWRKFYTDRVASAMFGKDSLIKNPGLADQLALSMNRLSDAAIRQTDKAVILRSDDGYAYLNALTVPCMLLTGTEDYVPRPAGFHVKLVAGGHVSPLETPEEVLDCINQVMRMRLPLVG